MNFDVLVKLVGYGKYIIETHLIELFKKCDSCSKDEIECDIYTMRHLDLIGKHTYYGYKINHDNIKKFLNSTGNYSFPVVS